MRLFPRTALQSRTVKNSALQNSSNSTRSNWSSKMSKSRPSKRKSELTKAAEAAADTAEAAIRKGTNALLDVVEGVLNVFSPTPK